MQELRQSSFANEETILGFVPMRNIEPAVIWNWAFVHKVVGQEEREIVLRQAAFFEGSVFIAMRDIRLAQVLLEVVSRHFDLDLG